MKSFTSSNLNVLKSSSLIVYFILFTASISAQPDPYQSRRDKLVAKTDKALVILVNNGGQDYVSTSGESMNFYYLTGIKTPNAVLVIDGKSGKSTVYRAASRYGQPESTPAGLEVKASEDLAKDLPKLAPANPTLWMEMNQLKMLDQAGFGLGRLETIKNITPQINDMRPVKDDAEIGLIRKAAEINALGLVEMMKAAEPGMNEKDLDLILDYTFKKLGSTGYSFGTQAASGPNSTSVHYGANNRTTQPGDMMVFDIGAEYMSYTADISRTIPISGKFTREQKEIYSVVLNAQKAAIAKMQPGRSINEAYQTVTNELNKGLFALGLLTDTTQVWQKSFWMQHGWGHHIGLVVHDVSGPYVPGKSDLLIPGMIYTMEPGLYFPADYLEKGAGRARNVSETDWKAFLKNVEPIFKKYINIGVRIEDDVLITPAGNEVITSAVPKEIAEIEAVMKMKSKFN
ncbi:MAG: M24 family metallopeptidase [Porphyromonadaceae bacterium]|nr:MAG: M24 family metallopeptidase [Porphyromonadaceae bacterium]